MDLIDLLVEESRANRVTAPAPSSADKLASATAAVTAAVELAAACAAAASVLHAAHAAWKSRAKP